MRRWVHKTIAMETKRRSSTPLFLLVLVFVASATCDQVEGRTCQFPSSSFKGVCVSDRNCASVCMGEGYGGGHCEGFRRRCLCQKRC